MILGTCYTVGRHRVYRLYGEKPDQDPHDPVEEKLFFLARLRTQTNRPDKDKPRLNLIKGYFTNLIDFDIAQPVKLVLHSRFASKSANLCMAALVCKTPSGFT